MREAVVELLPISPAAYKAEMKVRRMTGRALAGRWKTSEAWISKVINDPDRDPHWDDSIRGLEPVEARLTSDPLPSLPASALKAHIKQLGWTGRALAKRWGKSETWVSKIINDKGRDQHWSDAFNGLPSIKQ